MLGLKDDSILRDFEEEEWEEPSARKFDGDYVIYASRALEIPDDAGPVILCDFGDAHHGDNEHMGEVMPDLYRAPEIVLGIPWKEKIDIWSTGLMASTRFAAIRRTFLMGMFTNFHSDLGSFRGQASVHGKASQQGGIRGRTPGENGGTTWTTAFGPCETWIQIMAIL